MDDRRAELGYWIGVPWWNRGYATEAGRALLDFGFGTLGLHRIMAHHMMRNPASGRVMQKLGMTRDPREPGHPLAGSGETGGDEVVYSLRIHR